MKFLWKSPQFVFHATIAASFALKTQLSRLVKITILINGAAQYVAFVLRFAPLIASKKRKKLLNLILDLIPPHTGYGRIFRPITE